MIRKQIPNTITLLNLLSGILSIYLLFKTQNLLYPSLLILLGAFFDFFDGMFARILKVSSPIGKELDSLADVVSFGVAPSLIVVEILNRNFQQNGGAFYYLAFIPLLMALMSAYRLAKFNLDIRQEESFIGVPTPANAIFWVSIALIQYFEQTGIYLWGFKLEFTHNISLFLTNSYTNIILSLIFSFLLVSELKLLSLKFKNLGWKDNKERFIFIIIALFLIFAINFYAIPFVIALYIIVSLIFNTYKR